MYHTLFTITNHAMPLANHSLTYKPQQQHSVKYEQDGWNSMLRASLFGETFRSPGTLLLSLPVLRVQRAPGGQRMLKIHFAGQG